jgi:hypothetical protein
MNFIKQDLEVAIQAIKADNLELATIVGNRIASNAMLLDKKELSVLGLLVREASIELLGVQGVNEANSKKAKEIVEGFLNDLMKLEESKWDSFWTYYFDYQKRIRPLLITEIESKIYKENKELLSSARKRLIALLVERWQDIFIEDKRLVQGIANEIARLANTYGPNPDDLMFYLTMRSFANYCDWIVIDYQLILEENKKRMTKHVEDYVRRIEGAFRDEIKEDERKLKCGELLGDLTNEWRILFIVYGEIRLSGQERKPKLPSRIKKNIEEAIAESLRKEVSGGKG